MEHKGTKRIETERLLLRPFTPEDGPAMFRNWTHDAEVTKYLTWAPHETEATSRFLAQRWAEETVNPQVYQWAIVPKTLGEPIGSLSVVHMDDSIDAVELGYCIGRPWWGQGFVPEAVQAVIRYLIEEVGANRICARHDSNNPNSGRVMQKCGMTREGTLRAAGKNNQGLVDMVYYSILAEEYKRDW